MENLAALTQEALKLVADAQDLTALDAVRVNYLGKNGSITALMKTLGKLSAEERPAAGALRLAGGLGDHGLGRQFAEEPPLPRR